MFPKWCEGGGSPNLGHVPKFYTFFFLQSSLNAKYDLLQIEVNVEMVIVESVSDYL